MIFGSRPFAAPLGAVTCVLVAPRTVLVRAPLRNVFRSSDMWLPRLGEVIEEHRTGSTITALLVRMMNGDFFHCDPSWIAEDADFSNVVPLPRQNPRQRAVP